MNYPYFEIPHQPRLPKFLPFFLGVLAMTIAIILITISLAHAATPPATKLTASWYSRASLVKEGTWKNGERRMANGRKFNENNLTCATRLYPLGAILRITHIKSNASVLVRVTDRVGLRFAKSRIDLTLLAFSRIAEPKKGVVAVKVERIKKRK
jgi:rare lipoprotein A